MSGETPRSSADSSAVEDGYLCKVSLDCEGAHNEEKEVSYEAVLGSKEQCEETKQPWHRSLVWFFYDAFAAGLITGATVAFTFGFILPASEVVVHEILGREPIHDFFNASGKNKALWLISGIISGFILGSTHAVVSETLAMYIGQYTGMTSFEDIRPPVTNKWGKALRLATDVLTEDFIIAVGFAGALAMSSMIFFHATISPMIVQFTSCMIGGMLVGTFLLGLQKLRKGSFCFKRQERANASHRKSFFTIFESRIGALIRPKDFEHWVNGYLARVAAGVVFRPVAILTGVLVQARLEHIDAQIRVVVAFSSFTGAATLLCGWFFTLRLSGWLVKKYGPRKSGDSLSIVEAAA